MEGDHECVEGKLCGFEPEVAVEGCGAVVERLHGDGAHRELVGCFEDALQSVEQQTSTEAGALVAGGDGETGDECDWDWEVSREPPAHVGSCLLVFDLGGDEGVVADDVAIGVGGHEGAGCVASLGLASVGS